MQGTNAHLVVSTQGQGVASLSALIASAFNSTMWHQARHWFMAPVNPLLSGVLGVSFSAAGGLRRTASAVHMQARLGSPTLSVLLSNSCGMQQQTAVLLPAAATLMMAAAAVDSCSTVSSLEAAPQVVLANSVFGQLLWHKDVATALELDITLQAKRGTLSICSSGSNPVSVLSSAVVQHQAAGSATAGDAYSTNSTPAFLMAVMRAAQQHYDQLPGPIAKAQAASAQRAAPAAHLEPAVAAVCQLESTFMMPFLSSGGDAALAHVPATLSSCVLNPRGFGTDGALDVVDPDAPEEEAAGNGLTPRTSTFWISSSASGVGMQLAGMAYRPLSAAVQLAAATAVQVPAAACVAEHNAAAAQIMQLGAATSSAAATDAVVLASGATQVRGMVYRRLEQHVHDAASLDTASAAESAAAAASYTFSTEWVAVAAAADMPGPDLPASNSLQLLHASGTSPVASTAAVMSLLQASQQQQGGLNLQLHTSGAVGPVAGPKAAAGYMAAQAAPWAALRAANLEQTGVTLSAVDSGSCKHGSITSAVRCSLLLPRGDSRAAATGAELQGSLYGSCVTGSVLYEARLLRQPLTAAAQHTAAAAAAPELPRAARAGTYIITGGTGAVAGILGKWLVMQLKVQHVHFVSRSGRIPDSLLNLLAGSNSIDDVATAITASKADVGIAEDAAYVADPGAYQLPVLGLLHAAGVLSDSLLQHQTLSSIMQVMGPKVGAHQQLQRHLQQQPVSHQVLFSSVASLLGSPGQSNYAAANAGLDAAAQAAQCAGLPCISVQFGAWAGAGMAGRDAQTAARAARLGLALLTPDQALSVVSLAVNWVHQQRAGRPAVLAALPITWGPFLAHVPQPPSSYFSEFTGAALGAAAAASPTGPTPQPQELDASNPAAQAAVATAAVDAAAAEQQVFEAVDDAVSSILGASVEPDEPLMSAGLDSLGAVELRNMLQESLAVQLPNTVSLLCSHLSLVKQTQ
jgi:acyl carrier protein